VRRFGLNVSDVIPRDGFDIIGEMTEVETIAVRGCLETKPLSEKILGHMRGKAKNGLTE
jgi:hypothetical protein